MADGDIVRLATSKTVVPRPDNLNVELGVMMNLPFGTSYDATYGRVEDVPIIDLRQMRKSDGQVRALMRLLTLPVISTLKDVRFLPTGSGAKEADFINQVFTLPPQSGGMNVPLPRVVRQILLGIVEGFSAFEKVWTVPAKGPLAGKVTLRKLAYRSSDTVRFLVDEKGGFNGFRQIANSQGKVIDVTIPPDKSFYWAANEEENPFYGVSYFNPAFYHYDKKIKLYYLSHIAAQFAAVPGRLGFLKGNMEDAEAKAFKDALANFGFNTAVLIPQGYDVKPFESRSNFEFMKYIDHHNNQMSKSVLAQFIDSQQRQTVVDFSTDKDEMFISEIESIITEIEAAINYYVIPQLIDWNFGSDLYPVISLGEVTDDARAALQDIFKQLATSKDLHVTPEFMHEIEKDVAERLGLEMDYAAIDKRWAEEQAQQQLIDNSSNQLTHVTNRANIEKTLNPPPPDTAPGTMPPLAKPTAPPVPPIKRAAASAPSVRDVAEAIALQLSAVGLDEVVYLNDAAAQPRDAHGYWVADPTSGRSTGISGRGGFGGGGGSASGVAGGGGGAGPSDTTLRAAKGGGSTEMLTTERASNAEIEHAQSLANWKISNAPTYHEEHIAAHVAKAQASERAGGDLRGNNTQRADRKARMMADFGDGNKAPCVHCGHYVTKETAEADKILTLHEGGNYAWHNVMPSCKPCNSKRGDKSITQTGKLLGSGNIKAPSNVPRTSLWIVGKGSVPKNVRLKGQ